MNGSPVILVQCRSAKTSCAKTSLGLAQPSVCKHLRVLRSLGPVHVRRHGRQMLCRTNAEAIRPLYNDSEAPMRSPGRSSCSVRKFNRLQFVSRVDTSVTVFVATRLSKPRFPRAEEIWAPLVVPALRARHLTPEGFRARDIAVKHPATEATELILRPEDVRSQVLSSLGAELAQPRRRSRRER